MANTSSPEEPQKSTLRSTEDERACIRPDTPSPLQSARLAANATDRPNGKTKGTKRLKA